MKNTLWKFGLIGGIVMTVGFAISFLLGGDQPDYVMMEVIGYASILLSLLAVFFGIKSYRDRQPGGLLSFGRGMKLGVGITAVASLVLAVYTFAHIAWFDPDFGADYSAWQKQSIQASSATQEEKNEQIAKIDEMMVYLNSPLMQALIMYATVFIIGLVISLISSAILKRNGSGGELVPARS